MRIILFHGVVAILFVFLQSLLVSFMSFVTDINLPGMQEAPPQLGSVVKSLKKRFTLDFIYCWHGLPGYWSGVATPEEAPKMAKYNAKLVFAKPTPGLYEIEPSAAYNPSVVSGVGVVEDPNTLYSDMHAYLAQEGMIHSSLTLDIFRVCNSSGKGCSKSGTIFLIHFSVASASKIFQILSKSHDMEKLL